MPKSPSKEASYAVDAEVISDQILVQGSPDNFYEQAEENKKCTAGDFLMQDEATRTLIF